MDMTWKMKRVRVTLKTPLRCGRRPLGFVSRTLPFVPAHVPLAALTPVVVKQAGLPNRQESYDRVLVFLQNHVRFTPFFIRNPDDENVAPLFPFRNSSNLRRIEDEYLISTQHTAMDYANRGAREGCLFEIESISPVSRFDRPDKTQGRPVIRRGRPIRREEHKKRPTQMEGYVFWKTGMEQDLELDSGMKLNGMPLGGLIASCQWGGERNHGYGMLAEVSTEDADAVWNATPVNREDGSAPALSWPADVQAPFFLQYTPDMADQVSGSFKPISGRLFDPEKGPGQKAAEQLTVWDLGWTSSKALELLLNVRTAEVADVVSNAG